MRARGALLALVLAVLGACRLQLDVDVTVQDDGSGTIEVVAALDDDAVQRLGGDLAAVIDLDGLRAEGWTVDGPTRDDDGATRVQLRQPFDDPAGATEALAELSGEGGPFQALTVERDRSLTRTEWRFTGRLDLGRGSGTGPAGLDDAELEELQRQLGESLSRLVQVRVRVRLPGDVESNATTKADNGAVWQATFGGAPFDLEATGTQTRTATFVVGGLIAVAVVVLGAYGLIRLAGRSTASDDGPARR